MSLDWSWEKDWERLCAVFTRVKHTVRRDETLGFEMFYMNSFGHGKCLITSDVRLSSQCGTFIIIKLCFGVSLLLIDLVFTPTCPLMCSWLMMRGRVCPSWLFEHDWNHIRSVLAHCCPLCACVDVSVLRHACLCLLWRSLTCCHATCLCPK